MICTHSGGSTPTLDDLIRISLTHSKPLPISLTESFIGLIGGAPVVPLVPQFAAFICATIEVVDTPVYKVTNMTGAKQNSHAHKMHSNNSTWQITVTTPSQEYKHIICWQGTQMHPRATSRCAPARCSVP